VKLPYTFHRLAALELEAAEDAYETERVGAGSRFTSAVEAAITLLRQHPESAPVVRGAIRGKVLHRYPYG
jgi:plasmid stabilization system protein ParE